MKDKAQAFFMYSLIGLLVCIAILLVSLVVSIPFALLGAILLLAAKIFMTVEVTYFGSVIVGLAAYAIGQLLRR